MVQPAVFNPIVDWFAQQMKDKLGLPKNVAKGDWRDLADTSYLLQRLNEERRELISAMADDGSYDDIIKECADVANFSMMIADWCRYRNEHPELG